MEKRTVLFIIISIAVIVVWDLFIYQRPEMTTSTQGRVSSVATTASSAGEGSQKKAIEPGAPVKLTAKEVSSSLYNTVIVQENGFFRKVALKKYTVSTANKTAVDVFREGMLDVYDAVYLGDKSHRITYGDMRIQESAGDITATFTGQVADITITKKVRMLRDSYLGTVEYELKSPSGASGKISLGTVISQRFKDTSTPDEGNPLPHIFDGKNYEMPSERQMKKGFRAEKIGYGGVSEKYFALFFVDPRAQMQVDATLVNDRIDTILTVFEGAVGKDAVVKIDLPFFTGPRDPVVLKTVGHNLDRAIDYGFFHFIARPLLIVLNYFFAFTKNYGISIILLTILIKIAFFPLSQKSYRSMKELQKLQPKMEEIRKKHANDREAMNRETMNLYKKYGVNPMSGCLPMLVQIPFFIALYQALMNAIELRQAPFFLWIQDLSAFDPYYVTPLLMGATMLLQQMMTPSSGDPMQKKMMYLLPVVFTFMFLKFPSGLVLYWLINNVFSIAQQAYTIKKQDA